MDFSSVANSFDIVATYRFSQLLGVVYKEFYRILHRLEQLLRDFITSMSNQED